MYEIVDEQSQILYCFKNLHINRNLIFHDMLNLVLICNIYLCRNFILILQCNN